jgi:hypothetical protein
MPDKKASGAGKEKKPDKKEEKKDEKAGKDKKDEKAGDDKKDEKAGDDKKEKEGEKKEEGADKEASEADKEASEADKEGADKEAGEADKEGAEGAAAKPKDPCVDGAEPPCIGKSTADAIEKAIDNPGEMVSNAINDAAVKAFAKGKKILTDKTECVRFFIKEIPGLIPNLVENTGNAVSLAIDKVSNSMQKLFDEFNGDIPGYPNIIPPLEHAYALGAMRIQSGINTIILGPDGNKIMIDPNTTTEALLKLMEANSVNFKKLVSDDQFKAIFKKWMINYTSAFAETLELARPQLDELKGMIGEVVDEVSDKVGASLGKALTDVIKSAIGAIPGAGAVADLIISISQIGQNIVNACLPVVTKGAGIILPPMNMINRKVEETKNKLECLAKKVEPIMKKLEAATQITKQSGGITKQSGGITKQSGGITKQSGGITKQSGGAAVKKKIQQSTRRVQRMLRHFTRRKTKPLNYAKQLSKFRF